jgi:hypothetical protein
MSENTTLRHEPPVEPAKKAGKPAGKRHEVEEKAESDIKLALMLRVCHEARVKAVTGLGGYV